MIQGPLKNQHKELEFERKVIQRVGTSSRISPQQSAGDTNSSRPNSTTKLKLKPRPPRQPPPKHRGQPSAETTTKSASRSFARPAYSGAARSQSADGPPNSSASRNREETEVDSVHRRIEALLGKTARAAEIEQDYPPRAPSQPNHSPGQRKDQRPKSTTREPSSYYSYDHDDETVDTVDHELSAIEDLVSRRHVLK